jgi:pyruvate,water dikinase
MIVDLAGMLPPRRIGTKAERLCFLRRQGFAVPHTLACPWDLYDRHLRQDAAVLDKLSQALAIRLDPMKCYAVRSSANVEDQAEHSFAGQFRSVLDVQGVSAVLAAIQLVWQSARTSAVQAYRERHGLAARDLRMAVIIQEMVKPMVSGVAFSRNPLTGLDEVLVEAVAGFGDRLVQDGITPERWIWKWGSWIERPREPVLPTSIAEEVVQGARKAARAFGRPVDLEWVYDGQQLWWVQLREISGLGGLDVYSNRISGEFLPGLIKPLVWSVNVPLVNSAWIRLLTEIIGPNNLTPDRLARSFYYRAYFNMGPFGDIFESFGMPREGLELMMGLELGGKERPTFRPGLRALLMTPRLLGFLIGKLRYGSQVQADLDDTAPEGKAAYALLTTHERVTLGTEELLFRVDALYPRARRMAYHDILVALLERLHVRLLQSAMHKQGLAAEGLDLSSSIPEVAAIAPTVQLDRLHALYRTLPETAQMRIASATYADLASIPEAQPLRLAIESFLAQLGHLSDSGNDFSSVPWRENPDLALHLVVAHQPRPTQSVPWAQLPLTRWQRWRLSALYRLVRQYRILREQVSSRYTLGYGLFRELFLALGDRLVARGALGAVDDIFYLRLDEVRRLAGDPELPMHALAQQRRADLAQAERVTPPPIIFGGDAPPLVADATADLRGTPTSRGRHTGPVRQARSLADLVRVQPNDVLVVPYSDVSWTPLFARAGAVVAESGGMLSHSSIVAREYGIPAVVSVAGALNLPEDALVTVDGYSGLVTVHGDKEGLEHGR